MVRFLASLFTFGTQIRVTGLLLLVLLPLIGLAQTITSVQSGPWNSAATWGGTIPTSGNSSLVSIASGHAVNIPSGYSATAVSITITSSSTTSLTIDSGGSLSFTTNLKTGSLGSGKCNVNGLLIVNQGATITNGSTTTLIIGATGTYRHNYSTTAGTIYNATWTIASGSNPGATLEVAGYSGPGLTTPIGLTQTFYNVSWNCASQAEDFYLTGSVFPTVKGNFSIVNTNGFRFGFNPSVTRTLNFNGNLSISSGINFDMNESTNDVTINLAGNLSIGGDDGLAVTGSGLGTINFSGTSAQTVTSTAILSTPVNFTVAPTATVKLPDENFLSGGDVTLSGKLQVGSLDPAGAVQSIGGLGNLQNSGAQNFNTGCTISYSGTGAQFIGSGNPATTGVNVEINNSNGVSLASSVTIGGDLTLTSGNLIVGSNNTLTTEGNISGSSFISVSSTSSLVIDGSNGTNITGTYPFTAGAQTLKNLTLNRSGGNVTFANAVTVSGVVTLTAGDLIYNGQTLTLNGSFASTGSGTLSGNTSSTLSIGGSGAFGTLRVNSTNNNVGTFTFNRSTSGTGAVNGTFIVNTACNLLNGNFTNTSGLQIANGATLTRNSNAQLLGAAPLDVGQTYNVVYTGSTLTTGLELPTTATDMLASLTINGGPVALNQNIIVHGDVNLQSSTFQAGSNNITLSAASGTWNKTGGSFDGGTGTVIINGGISIVASSTPSFVNITANSGSTLTMPTGNITISGNLQLNSGGTFVANGGTIILNGNADQGLSAAGKTVNNLTISKTGGAANISTATNLTGILNIQTATTVATGGNLTLISNASGTASIAAIPAGASVTGSVAVQRYIANAARNYRDISSPVVSPTVSQIISSGITITGNFTGSSYPCSGCSTNNASMYYYNEPTAGAQTLGYTAFPASGGNAATTTLTTGRGYNLLVRNELGSPTMSLSGTINSGSISLPVSYTTTSGGTTEDGWNFVGNPYPCPIDWDIVAGWTKTNIQGNQISIWDPTKGTSGGYRVWNGSVGDLGSGRIAIGQGFWFKASAAPTLSLLESAKTTTTTTFYREQSEPVHYMQLVVTGSGLEDNVFIQKVDGAIDQLDNLDGLKLSYDGFMFSSLSKDNYNLSINALGSVPSDGQRLQLWISNIKPGSYTMSENAVGDFAGVKASILDQFTSQVSDLTSGSYNFTVTTDSASAAHDRFIIIFGDTPSVTTGIENGLPDLVQIHPNPTNSLVNVSVQSGEIPQGDIINSLGTVVGQLDWKQDPSIKGWTGSLNMANQASGMYLVRVKTDQGFRVVKFIKN